MPNMNDDADITFYYTAPLFLPATLPDDQFLGVYDSEADLPTNATPFSTAGIKRAGSMYVYLNNEWNYIGQYLFDAYRYLVYYQGDTFANISSPNSKWDSIFEDIANIEELMNEFANDSTAMSNLSTSNIAMQNITNSSTAMNAVMSGTQTETWWESSYYIGKGLATHANLSHTDLDSLNTISDIANDSTAMNDITTSPTAMNAIATSSTAINAIMSGTQTETWWGSSYYVGKGLATYANLSHTDLDSLNTISDIANDSTAMNDITTSPTAMNAIATSSTAINAIMSGTQTETWWGSSYYVGKGLATYANLSHTDLDPLNTISDITNNSTAMNDISASSTAMNVVANSSTAMNTIASSSTAMNTIWNSDMARQTCWGSSTARLAIYNNISILQSITINSDPNLISETPLNTDESAGYLTYVSKTYGTSNWTAVNINDGGKYIAFIHFYSAGTYDWYTGKIASYDQATNLQTTSGGENLTRGNCNATSNGLWIWFYNNATNAEGGGSYARAWYIKV